MSTLTAREMLAALNESGLTDQKIAEETGSTQATITRIRNGVHSEPKHKTWSAIQEFFLRRAAEAAIAQKSTDGDHAAR